MLQAKGARQAEGPWQAGPRGSLAHGSSAKRSCQRMATGAGGARTGGRVSGLRGRTRVSGHIVAGPGGRASGHLGGVPKNK